LVANLALHTTQIAILADKIHYLLEEEPKGAYLALTAFTQMVLQESVFLLVLWELMLIRIPWVVSVVPQIVNYVQVMGATFVIMNTICLMEFAWIHVLQELLPKLTQGYVKTVMDLKDALLAILIQVIALLVKLDLS